MRTLEPLPDSTKVYYRKTFALNFAEIGNDPEIEDLFELTGEQWWHSRLVTYPNREPGYPEKRWVPQASVYAAVYPRSLNPNPLRQRTVLGPDWEKIR